MSWISVEYVDLETSPAIGSPSTAGEPLVDKRQIFLTQSARAGTELSEYPPKQSASQLDAVAAMLDNKLIAKRLGACVVCFIGRREGLVHPRTKLPPGARSLISWLKETQNKDVDEITTFQFASVEQKVELFVEHVFRARAVRNADIEQLAPRLMTKFAIAIAIAVNVDDRYRDNGGTAAVFRAIAAAAQHALGDFIKEQEKWEAQTLVEHGDALAGMAMVIIPDTPLLKKTAK